MVKKMIEISVKTYHCIPIAKNVQLDITRAIGKVPHIISLRFGQFNAIALIQRL
jgi:hypothetical protein